jgi:nucleoside triphosphate diphosphatase
VTPSQPNPEGPDARPAGGPSAGGETPSAGDAHSHAPVDSGSDTAGSDPAPDPAESDAGPGTAAHANDSGARATLDDALDLVRFLRARCEWDAAQTPRSLLPYLLEEAHETADAIAAGDEGALAGELGDLLLNVAFQVVMAEERRAFSAADVVTQLQAKMRRRHPHLYGDGPRVDWATHKQRERGERGVDDSLLDDIAAGQEPLARAQRMQARVAEVGFDWPTAHGAFDKVVEEVEEVRELLDSADHARMEEELGDLLFAVVNLARLSGAHASRSLLGANAKFERRFREVETMCRERGIVMAESTLEELDEVWDEVKERERERLRKRLRKRDR